MLKFAHPFFLLENPKRTCRTLTFTMVLIPNFTASSGFKPVIDYKFEFQIFNKSKRQGCDLKL